MRMGKVEVICSGEALIDFVSTESGVALRDAPGFVRAAGGAPANVAAGLGKLGVKVAFMGMVGNDEFGAHLQEVLAKNNVDISFMKTTKKANTTLAFVSLRKDGERDFTFYRNPGADLLFSIADVAKAAFDGAKVFHFGSLSLAAEPARTATIHCAELAKEKGVIISYDPNWRLPLWSSSQVARKNMLLGLKYADWLKVSEEELLFITRVRDEDKAAKWLMRHGPGLICVTRGAKGATVWFNGTHINMPGRKVKVVDTTGAGDAFWAAFVKKLLVHSSLQNFTKASLREALRYAVVAGSVCVTAKGGIPALPTAEEIESCL